MMPYGKFHEAAELAGYDVELLGARFGASYEQVAHRLTTLARPTARGIPFFLIRVDSAGNVSKRFSSGRFPFAHFGGTCPLWNIHAAFTDPGHILTQVVELTDGSRWFSIARTVRRAITPYGAIEPHFAIGLGCEMKYAKPADLCEAARSHDRRSDAHRRQLPALRTPRLPAARRAAGAAPAACR